MYIQVRQKGCDTFLKPAQHEEVIYTCGMTTDEPRYLRCQDSPRESGAAHAVAYIYLAITAPAQVVVTLTFAFH